MNAITSDMFWLFYTDKCRGVNNTLEICASPLLWYWNPQRYLNDAVATGADAVARRVVLISRIQRLCLMSQRNSSSEPNKLALPSHGRTTKREREDFRKKWGETWTYKEVMSLLIDANQPMPINTFLSWTSCRITIECYMIWLFHKFRKSDQTGTNRNRTGTHKEHFHKERAGMLITESVPSDKTCPGTKEIMSLWKHNQANGNNT